MVSRRVPTSTQLALGLSIPVVLGLTACSAARDLPTSSPSRPTPTTEPVGTADCRQFDSFSGRTVVGSPTGSSNGGGLIEIEPGVSLGPAEWPRLDSVSMGSTPDTDSVVFEVSGNGIVGWSGRFVQDPRTYVSGSPTEVAGSCILQLDLTGFDPVEEDQETSPQRLTSAETSPVVEALTFPAVDGLSQTFVGMRGSTPTVSIGPSVIDNRTVVVASIAR